LVDVRDVACSQNCTQRTLAHRVERKSEKERVEEEGGRKREGGEERGRKGEGELHGVQSMVMRSLCAALDPRYGAVPNKALSLSLSRSLALLISLSRSLALSL
jgi:hypothetical protein